MSNTDDVYDRKNGKSFWTLGGLAGLITAIVAVLTFLAQAGVLPIDATPAPVVVVPINPPAPTAQPVVSVPTTPVGPPPATQPVVLPTAAPPTAPPAVPTPVPATSVPPSLPTQAAGVTNEVEQFVSDFLSRAIAAEILTFTYSDAAYAAQFTAGERLLDMQESLATLISEGLYVVPQFDAEQSYIADIRIVHDYMLEVDTCEVWAKTFYRLSDGAVVQVESPTLIPQTITIEQFNLGWYITHIDFYDPPSFCQ